MCNGQHGKRSDIKRKRGGTRRENGAGKRTLDGKWVEGKGKERESGTHWHHSREVWISSPILHLDRSALISENKRREEKRNGALIVSIDGYPLTQRQVVSPVLSAFWGVGATCKRFSHSKNHGFRRFIPKQSCKGLNSGFKLDLLGNYHHCDVKKKCLAHLRRWGTHDGLVEEACLLNTNDRGEVNKRAVGLPACLTRLTHELAESPCRRSVARAIWYLRWTNGDVPNFGRNGMGRRWSFDSNAGHSVVFAAFHCVICEHFINICN